MKSTGSRLVGVAVAVMLVFVLRSPAKDLLGDWLLPVLTAATLLVLGTAHWLRSSTSGLPTVPWDILPWRTQPTKEEPVSGPSTWRRSTRGEWRRGDSSFANNNHDDDDPDDRSRDSRREGGRPKLRERSGRVYTGREAHQVERVRRNLTQKKLTKDGTDSDTDEALGSVEPHNDTELRRRPRRPAAVADEAILPAAVTSGPTFSIAPSRSRPTLSSTRTAESPSRLTSPTTRVATVADLLSSVGLAELLPLLETHDLTDLSLLVRLARSDGGAESGSRLRAVLREAGISKVGQRERVALAVEELSTSIP